MPLDEAEEILTIRRLDREYLDLRRRLLLEFSKPALQSPLNIVVNDPGSIHHECAWIPDGDLCTERAWDGPQHEQCHKEG